MDLFFEDKLTLKQRFRKHQVAIYVTVIVHLLVVIVLLGYKINDAQREKMSIMFDFSRDEAREREEKLVREKEELKDEVEKLFNDARAGRVVRNVAVNTADIQTSTLKDAKGINESVYDDARTLQEKLDASRERMKDLQTAKNEVPVYNESQQNTSKNSNESYTGPSVLSYTLDGRRAMHLPVPVYKCPGGGDVTVAIEVNKNGHVVSANVVSSASTQNDCLYEAACRAAKSSRFSASNTAPNKQDGIIVYRFVAQ